jgi:hypothetical protein
MGDELTEYSGWMDKDKGDNLIAKSLSILKMADRRFFRVRDGFFAYYKKEEVCY